MRKLHSGALNMIECHHGVPLDTECPKCMEVAICGADAPPELTDNEVRLMSRIAELEGALEKIAGCLHRDQCEECSDIASAALRSDSVPTKSEG
jgi:hypothetical protein